MIITAVRIPSLRSQYHDFTFTLDRINDCTIAVFGFGWSLSSGCAYTRVVLSQVALVHMHCF
jgi:hypothetical protein